MLHQTISFDTFSARCNLFGKSLFPCNTTDFRMKRNRESNLCTLGNETFLKKHKKEFEFFEKQYQVLEAIQLHLNTVVLMSQLYLI